MQQLISIEAWKFINNCCKSYWKLDSTCNPNSQLQLHQKTLCEACTTNTSTRTQHKETPNTSPIVLFTEAPDWTSQAFNWARPNNPNSPHRSKQHKEKEIEHTCRGRRDETIKNSSSTHHYDNPTAKGRRLSELTLQRQRPQMPNTTSNSATPLLHESSLSRSQILLCSALKLSQILLYS